MNLRKAIKKKPLVGGWTLSGSPCIAEVFAPGFDFVVVDVEHGSATFRDVEACITAVNAADGAALVRVRDENDIGIVLDLGACGVIVPRVSNRAQMENIIDACIFPAEGKRSFSLARCTGYGLGAKKYYKQFNDRVFICAMIETREGVENLDDILDAMRLDAVLVGPYDLSGSLGKPGNFKSDEFIEAMQNIERTCDAAGVPYGIHDPHATPEHVVNYIRGGMRFVAAGMDTTVLSSYAKKVINTVAER